MEPTIYLAILFTVLTLLLLKTKYERHLLFFMIRTQYGIRLINALARMKPRFWKFIGDLGIVVSFSGIGGFYLSKKKESQDNLHVILAMIGLATIALAPIDVLLKPALCALLVFVILALRASNNPTINFIATSLLISLAVRPFIPKLYFVLLMGVFGVPAVIIMALVQQAYEISQGSMLPGVSPMLPSTREGNIGVGFPGYDIFIPWWYALIAIIATLAPHELAHGILSRVHHIKLKSTGLLTFGALPIGAFVEPDEQELNSKSSVSRTRVYAVGSLANFAVGILATILLVSTVIGLDQVVVKQGVEVVAFDAGYPAEAVLKRGVVVHQLNNNTVYDITSFEEAATTLKPGDNATLATDQGTFTITAAQSKEDNGRGYMGVLLRDRIAFKYGVLNGLITPTLLSFFITALSWIAFFNINIGMVNLLPIPPFDGYKIFDEIVKSTGMKKEDVKWVIYGVIIATALVFFLNLFPLVRMVVQPVLTFFGF